MRVTLDDPSLANRTGRGVIVAVLDSGIHAEHPHINGISGGVSLVSTEPDTDVAALVDRIGHGTAVAAAIREKSPDVELLAVRVFDRQLATTVDVLCRAIAWSAEHGARLINLSLGTANAAHAERLAEAVAYAQSRGALVVSAAATGETQWFPGSLAGVVGVIADTAGDRESIELIRQQGALPRIAASPFPRPIPGVPRERNLAGVSFAVANVTGFLARLAEGDGRPLDQVLGELLERPARDEVSNH
jgi:subtilisin family serine protease